MTKNALEIFKQRAAKNPELQKAYEREKEAYHEALLFRNFGIIMPNLQGHLNVAIGREACSQILENHFQDVTKKDKKMKQCEIERLQTEIGGINWIRTGIKKICWLDKVTDEMKGKIIDIKKLEGLWVINEIYEGDREIYEINRGWHVGGL